ncbi:VOC family protein [Paraburkholderia caffeinilytica]|uniref:VOC family protein n=1 Tax=Paraburkholderia caffeinilytica TaxID=1761016 RepID=UPI0038BB5D32
MSTSAAAALDHVVINVRTRLDEAQQLYRRLGFHLTHRGHHSIGTSNHLAVFQSNYLELLGYVGPDAEPPTDLVDTPAGLRALALKPNDPAAVEAQLVARGLLAEPPADFSRQVAHSEGIGTARFRILKVRGDWVTDGSIFYCHHYTPDLVWRDEWRQHPNGVTDVMDVFVRTPHAEDTAAAYAEATGGTIAKDVGDGTVHVEAGGARVFFMSPEQATLCLEVAPPVAEWSDPAADQMVGLRLLTASILMTREVLSHNQIPFRTLKDGSVLVDARNALGVALIFTDSDD